MKIQLSFYSFFQGPADVTLSLIDSIRNQKLKSTSWTNQGPVLHWLELALQYQPQKDFARQHMTRVDMTWCGHSKMEKYYKLRNMTPSKDIQVILNHVTLLKYTYIHAMICKNFSLVKLACPSFSNLTHKTIHPCLTLLCTLIKPTYLVFLKDMHKLSLTCLLWLKAS